MGMSAGGEKWSKEATAQTLIATYPIVGKHVFHPYKMLEMGIGKILQLVFVSYIFEGDLVDKGNPVGYPYPKPDRRVQVARSQQVPGPFLLDKSITPADPDKRICPAIAPRLEEISETVIQRTVKGNIIQVVHLHIAILADLVISDGGLNAEVVEKVSAE